MSVVFSPYRLKDVVLRNRIAVPPMCQYSAHDGLVSDWHLPHYASIARGGPGLVIVEATAVSPEGRITPGCLGLWSDDHIPGLATLAKAIKAGGAVPGIQIGHAGRKASANRPWEGDDHIAADDPRGWPTISPSATAFGGNLPKIPREMTLSDIARVQADFAAAARRAAQAGFEWLELHLAHGYLGQSFFSVHANRRTDAYGGDLAGRNRFLIETVKSTRAVWPERLPLTARFGVIEYDGRDEQTLADAIATIQTFRREGLDFVNVSLGFSTPKANIPWAPAFLLPVAARVRRDSGLPVATAWGLDNPATLERAIGAQEIDVAMIGKAFLANPHWTLHAAQKLNIERPTSVLPPNYDHWLAHYRSTET